MTRKQPELKTNVIICGDCERRMKEHIPKESIDLIYLDPPFFSGKDYDLIWGKKGETKSKATLKVFEDAALFVKKCGECGRIWRKNNRGEYYKTCEKVNCKGKLDDTKDVRMSDVNIFTEWLRPRLEECYRVLKPTGSIYCHLDWHSVHYIKVMMDEIFGYKNFQNEIVWHYHAGSPGKTYKRKHDTILFYTKTDTYTFNDPRMSYAPKDEYRFSFTDENGRKYRINHTKDKNGDYKRFYWDTGTNQDDVFTYVRDSKFTQIGSTSRERLGYDTQKPEALLEQIIKTSSNPGDIILDPFCGCGTAIAVAQKSDRKWIGIDVEPLSCTVMQHRLATMKDHKIETEIIDLKRTLTEKEANDIIIQSEGMNGHDFQNWIIDIINGTPNPKHSDDRGTDGWIDEPLTGKLLRFGTLDNGDPIQVKMMDRIGGPVIRLFATDMQDYSEHGVIIAYGFANTADKEVGIAHKKHGVEIELLTIRDILMLTDKDAVKRAAKLPKGQEHLGSFV